MSMTLSEFVHRIGFDIDFEKLETLNSRLHIINSTVKETFNGLDQIAKKVQHVGRSLSIGITAPLLALGIASVKTAGDLEQIKLALSDALGSKAPAFFEKIDKFTRNKSNFDRSQVYNYANALLQAKVPMEDVIDLMQKLGDIGAGDARKKGKGGKGDIQSMIDAITEMKTHGKIEVGRLSGLGPAVMLQLQKQLGMSGTMFSQFMGTGVVNSGMVMKAIDAVARERQGAMIRQASTFNGLLVQTGNAISTILEEIGNIIMKETKLKSILVAFIKGLYQMVDWLHKLNPTVKTLLLGLVALAALGGPVLVLVGAFGQLALGIVAAGFAFESLKLAGLGSRLLAIIGPVGLLLALLYLIFDEVNVWVNNGDSVLGKLLGPWETFSIRLKKVVKDTKDAFKELLGLQQGGLAALGGDFGKLYNMIDRPFDKYHPQQEAYQAKQDSLANITINQTIPAGSNAAQAKFIKDSTEAAFQGYLQYQDTHFFSKYTYEQWDKSGRPK
jgi:hypothetical protein